MSGEITQEDKLDFQANQDAIETGSVFQFQKPIGFDPEELDQRKDQVIQAHKDTGWDGVLDLVQKWVEEDLREQHAEVVRSIGSYFTQGNAEVSKWGFIFAVGLDAAEGNSMEDVAQRIGVSRAAISKEARAWCERLRLPESRYMRSAEAVVTYTKRAEAVHAAHNEDELDRGNCPKDVPTMPPSATLTPTSLTMQDNASPEDYKRVIQALAQANNGLQWWVGDWLVQAGKKYGETYKGWVAGLGWDYQTLRNCKYVSANVQMSLRKDNLPWYHHAAVAHLAPAEQQRWLDVAAKKKLSVRLLRECIEKNIMPGDRKTINVMRSDTIEQWAGVPMRQWKRNVFERLLDKATKERLKEWARHLKPAADMYQRVCEKLT